jgi:hypothetical protein
MKLKKYNQLLEEIDPKDWEDDDDNFYREDEYSYLNDKLDKRTAYDEEEDDWEGYTRYGHGPYDDDDYESGEEPIEEDDMQNLLYLLRTMFRNSGIEEVYVENKKMDITITVAARRRERLKDIINIFAVANKLKKDILAQYDSEFEMWESKEGSPLFVFNFYYDEGLEDDMAPF